MGGKRAKWTHLWEEKEQGRLTCGRDKILLHDLSRHLRERKQLEPASIPHKKQQKILREKKYPERGLLTKKDTLKQDYVLKK